MLSFLPSFLTWLLLPDLTFSKIHSPSSRFPYFGLFRFVVFFVGTFDRKTFWKWAHFKDYVAAVAVIAGIAGAATLLLGNRPLFVEGLGLVSLLLEAGLGLPQLINNWRNQSTEGMR